MSEFKTKARAVELLGRKQIRDSVTALAELMKNSYDADAKWLRVEFSTKKKPECIVISDTGIGMSREDVESKWLVLGTNSKTAKKEKTSPGGRPLMGAKGIGRLASAKLGRQLWMFTKTPNGFWNIVYIHWGVFENPYLSISDVHIPTRFEIPTEELCLRFEQIIDELRLEQKKNLNFNNWFINNDDEEEEDDVKFIEALYNQIDVDLNNNQLNNDSLFQLIKTLDTGTILHISGLNDDWGKYLSPKSLESRKEDAITEKMYNRFASFVSTFKHTNPYNIPFEVEVYLNGNLWDADFDYIDEDYNIFDIKIDGTVRQGFFTGSLEARNADAKILNECNNILKEGINLTSGIADWEKIDCGKYSIKICHIEGEKKNSGLSSDDYDRMRRKLEITCGVCVYRDGVRVLPYGEPENDFLNIEERRSLNAGNYIFSHRNIFGRIDIDSKNNPLLEDKSSREGLIENSQYYFFVKTIENLLIDLAMNFLSGARKESKKLRESYIYNNKQQLEARKAKEKFEQEELQLAKQEIIQRQIILNNSQTQALILNSECEKFCANWRDICAKLTVDDGYNQLKSIMEELVNEYQTLLRKLQEYNTAYNIVIPKRFEHYFNDEIKNIIFSNNAFVKESYTHLYDIITGTKAEMVTHIDEQLSLWEKQVRVLIESEPETYHQILSERLTTVIENSRIQLQNLLDFSYKRSQELENDLIPVLNLIDIVNKKDYVVNTKEWDEVQKQIAHLSEINELVRNIFNRKPADVAIEGEKLFQRIENDYQRIYTQIQKIQLSEGTRISSLAKQASAIIHAQKQIDSTFSDELIIGELRQENIHLQAEMDIYSDLANLGLASEIVNHEFNQLFTNVNNAIKNMIPYIKDPNANYWLKQIDMGFRSISDRQNQLSPMYRSYSLRKREVVLYDFINEVCRFMSGALERDNITIINCINPEVKLILSPSKVFPAISNIINNAMYWVLNQSVRQIKLRFNSETKALYIEDSGSGIAALDKERIFEPFVSFKPNGRGLGLAVARKALESQGYTLDIALDDEKTLSGACFKIVFAGNEV